MARPNAQSKPAPKPELTPAARLADVRAYDPPAPRWTIDLRLDANEGAPPDPRVLDAMRVAGPERARRYPDARPLERAIADRWGIDPARVIVTNGGDDAIDRAARACLEPGRAMVTHAPSFVMIPRAARLAGAEVVSVPWLDGPFPADALERAIDADTGLVALVSPNNPTGTAIKPADIERLADRARAVGAAVLLDLAYVEFADHDPTPDLLERDNIVIVRTFSKAMGLAGLRVGYAIAPGPIAGWLRAAGGPYPVAGPALAAAETAWDARTNAYPDRVRTGRADLSAQCRRLGLKPLETEANFVTVTSRSAWLHDALGSLGIAVRRLDPSEHPTLCRITLPGTADDFDRLARTIETAASPEVILFDMDGVLADVSASYRAAITAAARTFGVTITPADIAGAKAAGDANNDWVLTQRLLAQRGVDATLDDVTARFQQVYLGDANTPGLRETERLICERRVLESLRASVPLAIVTGRPGDEARWFLERAGIADLFETVVAMEDAPPKPAPDPVALALQRTGASRAWLIGDTPDDALAARAAAVVPIGILGPGDTDPRPLLDTGVARVLETVADLGDLLP